MIDSRGSPQLTCCSIPFLSSCALSESLQSSGWMVSLSIVLVFCILSSLINVCLLHVLSLPKSGPLVRRTWSMECWHFVCAMAILLVSCTGTGGGQGLGSLESPVPRGSSLFWDKLQSDAVMPTFIYSLPSFELYFSWEPREPEHGHVFTERGVDYNMSMGGRDGPQGTVLVQTFMVCWQLGSSAQWGSWKLGSRNSLSAGFHTVS